MPKSMHHSGRHCAAVTMILLLLLVIPALAAEPELGHERVKKHRIRSTEPTLPFVVGVGVDGGLGFASGDFFDDSDAGLRYGVSLRVGLTPKYYLKAGYHHTDLALGLTALLNELTGVDLDASVRQYRLAAGMLVNQSRGYSLGMFMEAGLEVASYHTSIHGDGVDANETESRLMASFCLGGLFPLSDTMAFEMGLSPAIKLTSSDELEDEGSAVLLGLHLGLVGSFH